jgi:hypothetical protein
MSFTTAAPPIKSPISDKQGFLTDEWVNWFSDYVPRIDKSPSRLITVTLTGQSASLAITPFTSGTLAEGRYRVDWYARITTAATTNSSLTVNVRSTESGLSLTQSGAAMTGNTTTTVQSGSALVLIDAGTPISYSTTYASTGATPMAYRLTLLLTRVDA